VVDRLVGALSACSNSNHPPGFATSCGPSVLS
jgi:hypothetical protein